MKWTWKRHTYERRGRQMHSFRTQFLILVSGGVLGKLHPIIWSCISLWMFPYKLPQFGKCLYLEHLCTMASISSLKKDYIAPTRDSFKIVSLHVKLVIKCIQTSRKEKFHKQRVVILFKNDCSVRHMFCTTFVSLSVAKNLAKHVQSRS